MMVIEEILEGDKKDENRNKSRVSENKALLESILNPLGFKSIKRNKENRRKDKSKIGYDFTAKKDGKLVTIEVKGPTLDKNGIIKGIPDAAGTEFTDVKIGGSPKFKADYLLVIGLENLYPYRPKIAYLIPREVVNLYDHVVKPTIVFANELKTRLKNTEASTDDGIKIIRINEEIWKESQLEGEI